MALHTLSIRTEYIDSTIVCHQQAASCCKFGSPLASCHRPGGAEGTVQYIASIISLPGPTRLYLITQAAPADAEGAPSPPVLPLLAPLHVLLLSTACLPMHAVTPTNPAP